MFDRGGVILGSKGFWLYDCVVLKKRYSGNTGQKDKRKARIWVEDFKAAKRREAANSIIGIQADPTFDCHFLLQEWLANHSGKHASNVKADWDNYILPKIGSIPVMKVTTGMVEEIRTNYLRTPSFLNVKGKVADQMKAKALQTKAEGKQPKEKVSKPKTNNGANKVINHLNFVFSWGVKTDRLPRMPFKKLKKLVEQEAVKTFLRPEQVKPFLAEIDSLNNLPVMVMIRAMLYIGLREGEAVAMKWTGFDEGRKVFTAVDTKTGQNYPLPVPKDLREMLVRLRDTVDEGCPWVFPSSYNSKTRKWRHRASQFTAKAIKRAGKNLGITGLSPHRLRGSFSTLLARSGANAHVIKAAGRWKCIQTSMRYVQIVSGDVAAAQAKAFGFTEE